MDFALTSRTSTRLLEERKKSSQCREIRLHVKYDVISMPRQLRCHYNPDQNEFSSLSNTDVVIIFKIFVNDEVAYAQTWEVLTMKKPYRATLTL